VTTSAPGHPNKSKPIARDITAVNRRYYDAFWSKARLFAPDRFNTWPLVAELLPSSPVRLELGPGLRPRLPIAGTHFVDISAPAVEQLNARGGIAMFGQIDALPFEDREFDLVCAFDVIEHVADDGRVFSEITRVLKDDGVLMFSVPAHADRWTEFDDWVGHARRYDPPDLLRIMARHRLRVEKSAVFGMQPANPDLVKRGMWWMEHHRSFAMFWYNWVGLPLALLFQKRLEFVHGLIDMKGVDEMVMVCRKVGAAASL
jgi:SAM-dependent methyltransferase